MFISSTIKSVFSRTVLVCYVCVYTCWPGASVGTLWRPTTRIFNSKRALSLYDNPCVLEHGTWVTFQTQTTCFQSWYFDTEVPDPWTQLVNFLVAWESHLICSLLIVRLSESKHDTKFEEVKSLFDQSWAQECRFVFVQWKIIIKKTTFVRLFGHKHFWLFILSSGLLVKTDVFSGQIDQQLSHSLSHTHKVQINGLKQIKDHFRTETMIDKFTVKALLYYYNKAILTLLSLFNWTWSTNAQLCREVHIQKPGTNPRLNGLVRS